MTDLKFNWANLALAFILGAVVTLLAGPGELDIQAYKYHTPKPQ